MKERPTIPNRVSVSYVLFTAILFILNGCFSTTSDPSPGNSGKNTPEPTANFVYSIGLNGNVDFTNLSINATDYEWDFGDNTGISIETHPTHQYQSNGSYSVTLTATGEGGTKSTFSTIPINNIQGSITYKNTTQTDITITINGETLIAAPNASVSFFGEPNSPATGSAFTYGATSSGTQIGLKLEFDFDDTFTSPGSTVNLGIGGSFFFLTVKNLWAYPITKVYVNYGLPSQTLDNILIPNDGQTYGLGYYENVSTPNVRFENGGQVWSSNIYPGFETNTIADLEVK